MDTSVACTRCGRVVPGFTPGDAGFRTVVAALGGGGSRGLAAAEYRHLAQCTEAEAMAWITHLLDCTQAWPSAPVDDRILARIGSAFAGIAKPAAFTDRSHCDECAEHDDTLRAHTVQSVRRADLGSSGWDPITFSSADGIGYYFPALARFALLPDVWGAHDWYAVQLVNHLGWEGRDNRFLAWCSPTQREAVHALLAHLAATREDALVQHGCHADLQAALATWAPDEMDIDTATP